MGQVVDPPNDNTGDGSPGTPGYVPGTGPNTKLATVVTSTNVQFTAAQISGAGGPWPSFKVRVTPINDNGSGAYQEVSVPASP